ncbi:hypothetical protein Cadr_000017364 [Camelus dromedarius]|uniref:Uncharacterized protein n=1 Tax=Camelus dromedarius TaxID=9838 RepID=A0A5N4DGN0_CAMDR|nr:hypothetical protein Cadr_000017364 [Camelus dromedarius]
MTCSCSISWGYFPQPNGRPLPELPALRRGHNIWCIRAQLPQPATSTPRKASVQSNPGRGRLGHQSCKGRPASLLPTGPREQQSAPTLQTTPGWVGTPPTKQQPPAGPGPSGRVNHTAPNPSLHTHGGTHLIPGLH